MKLLDTIVLVSAMNPADRYHKDGLVHLRSLQSAEGACVPSSALIEFDLVLRNSGYTENEIGETWRALTPLVGRKLWATTPSAHLNAADLRSKGLTYFDSLITALAKEMRAVVITRDAEISKHVDTEW